MERVWPAVHEIRQIESDANVEELLSLRVDVAAMIVFLLSEASSWMTGTVIPVDGGMMAG